MASAKQACAAIDEALLLPRNTANGFAARLRAAELLPATQGRPEEIDAVDVATILVAAVTSSAVASDYMKMWSASQQRTFNSALASFIESPFDLFELRIDAISPGAAITYRGPDRSIKTEIFTPLISVPRPAFTREVVVGPDVFIRLRHALDAAPETRAGRPSTANRYSRYERATCY